MPQGWQPFFLCLYCPGWQPGGLVDQHLCPRLECRLQLIKTSQAILRRASKHAI
jgi:hypothetical protein